MKAVEKVSIIDNVVSQLKEFIISDEISIGDKLPTEKAIYEKLNVGRSTVREAFRILQAMGFVEMKAGRGAFVARKTEEDKDSIVNWFITHEIEIIDFIEVRMAIEPLAVKLAIERASQEEIDKLEEIYVKFKEAVDLSDTLLLSTYDEAFHNQIIKSTHNQLIISISDKISDVFAEYRSKAFSVKENAKNALGPHKTILEAIKKRDTQKGQKAMLEHLIISMQDISKVVSR